MEEELYSDGKIPGPPWWHSEVFDRTLLDNPADLYASSKSALVKQALQENGTVYEIDYSDGLKLTKEGDPLLRMFVERCGGRLVFTGGSMDFYAGPSIAVQLIKKDFYGLDGFGDRLVIFEFCTNSKRTFDQFQKLLETHTPPFREYVHENPGSAYIMANIPMRGIQIIPLGVAGEDLVRENYMPDVLEKYDFAVADLHKKDPFGRLVILDGPPGTGKTHMVQAIMKACPQSKFVTIPPKLLKDLEDPGFILTYVREMDVQDGASPLVLVLEDADQCLAERKSDNIGSIQAILNLSDGIVGKLLNLRILATTNTPIGKETFDAAVLRKGRLSAHIKVGYLDKEQSAKAWKKIVGNEALEPDFKIPHHDMWDNKIPLSDVYSHAKEFVESREKK